MGQRLLGHRTGGHQGGGEAAGEVSAAPVVLAPLALDEAGIVPMAGPGGVADGLIVLGVLVGVGNEHGQRRADGLALEYAGENFYLITLTAGCSVAALSRLSAIQINLNVGLCKEKSCRYSVHNCPKCLAVRFSPGSYCEFFSEC